MVDTEKKPPADEGRLETGVRPRAWAIFVDNGNARMWSTLQPHVQKLADAEGLEVTPLYDQAAIDSARQAIYAAEAAQLTAPLHARIETLLRGINDARCLMDPIWRERMGAEQVREHVQRGMRCIASAITDCQFTGPNAEVTGQPRTGAPRT